jgi:hypothetical protein
MKYPMRFLVATLLAASCQIIHAADAAGQAHQSVVSTRWKIDELDAMLKEKASAKPPCLNLGFSPATRTSARSIRNEWNETNASNSDCGACWSFKERRR